MKTERSGLVLQSTCRVLYYGNRSTRVKKPDVNKTAAQSKGTVHRVFLSHLIMDITDIKSPLLHYSTTHPSTEKLIFFSQSEK